MNDDDIWNSVLGNNPGSGLVDDLVYRFGQPGWGQPPQSMSPPTIDSLLALGIPASTVAAYFSQADDPGAASLPPSAPQPPAPLFGGMAGSPLRPSYPPSPSGGMDMDPATLSSLMELGVGGDVIAGMLPQRNPTFAGTSAPSPATNMAFLSAPVPSQPPKGTTPSASPDMTMDQAAMAWGMSPEQVAQIHRDALKQAATNIVTDAIVGGAVDAGLPEVGVPDLVVHLVGAGMTVHDALDIAQRLRDAPDQAIFKRLNDAEIQSIPSSAKSWLP